MRFGVAGISAVAAELFVVFMPETRPDGAPEISAVQSEAPPI
jgi:hypothetical protein